MALDTVVRSAVGVANSVTGALQVDVTHLTGQTVDKYNKRTGGTTTTRQAIVDYKVRKIRLRDGTEHLSRADVFFIGNVTVLVTDVITLPDGTTGPILDIGGLADPENAGDRFYTSVMLG